jgi:hypothetical protein
MDYFGIRHLGIIFKEPFLADLERFVSENYVFLNFNDKGKLIKLVIFVNKYQIQ